MDQASLIMESSSLTAASFKSRRSLSRVEFMLSTGTEDALATSERRAPTQTATASLLRSSSRAFVSSSSVWHSNSSGGDGADSKDGKRGTLSESSMGAMASSSANVIVLAPDEMDDGLASKSATYVNETEGRELERSTNGPNPIVEESPFTSDQNNVPGAKRKATGTLNGNEIGYVLAETQAGVDVEPAVASVAADVAGTTARPTFALPDSAPQAEQPAGLNTLNTIDKAAAATSASSAPQQTRRTMQDPSLVPSPKGATKKTKKATPSSKSGANMSTTTPTTMARKSRTASISSPAMGSSSGGKQNRSSRALPSSSVRESGASLSISSSANVTPVGSRGTSRKGREGTGSRGSSPGGSRPSSRSGFRGSRLRMSASTGRRSTSSRKTNAVPLITEKALASINYSLFIGPNIKPKVRRTKMMSEFVHAYTKGFNIYVNEWQTEMDNMYAAFRDEGFGPQARQILQLVQYTKYLKEDCTQKVHFAESVANSMLSGVEGLLSKVKESGLVLCKDTDVLKYRALFVDDSDEVVGVPMAEVLGHDAFLSNSNKKNNSVSVARAQTAKENRLQAEQAEVCGVPMPEVRDHDAFLTENNPPGVFIPDWEKDEVRNILRFFNDTLSLLARDVIKFDAPLPLQQITSRSFPTENAQGNSAISGGGGLVEEHVDVVERTRKQLKAYEVARARESQAVAERLKEMATATAHLLHRVKIQDDRNKRKIAAQQRALDEGATRQKLSDDILNGTVQQGKGSADYSVEQLRALSAELRWRMDALEREVREDLQALISSSAELCIAANAYGDESSLRRQKEECVYRYMTVTERRTVEQATILRDVQDKVMQLWSDRERLCGCGGEADGDNDSEQEKGKFMVGREEKDTRLSRALPIPYAATLKLCDQDTLVRILHHISIYHKDAAKTLMGALDEYEHFLRSNTKEGVALKEQELKRLAVTQLLEKLDEEGMIHSNTRKVSSSLAETVEHMVNQYNAFMNFDEKCARAELRRNEKIMGKAIKAGFFDNGTPVPASVAQLAADHKQIANPYSRVLYPNKPAEAHPAVARDRSTSLAAVTTSSSSILPHNNSGNGASQLPTIAKPNGGPTVVGVVTALSRSNPSMQNPTASSVSVVGDGRWGGRAAVSQATGHSSPPPVSQRSVVGRSEVETPRRTAAEVAAAPPITKSSTATTTLFAQTAPSFLTKPTLPPRVCRDSTMVGSHASSAAVTSQSARQNNEEKSLRASTPSPGLPVRSGLIEHTMREYNNSVEDLVSAAVVVEDPQHTHKKFHDDDLWFIDRQRALFKLLQE